MATQVGEHVVGELGRVRAGDRATGTMRSDPDGSGRFTEAVLHPEVSVAEESMVEAATRAHRRASELCFIANSVRFRVRHEPAVQAAR